MGAAGPDPSPFTPVMMMGDPQTVTDPDISRAAQTLADHALVLLAIGIALIGLALVGIVVAVRLGRRHQARLARGWAWCVGQACRIPVVGPRIRNARVVVPPKYVLLHLVLGLVATAAVVAFIVVAEEVFAGRAVAQFDHAFSTALRDSASAEWQRFFRFVTHFGSGDVLGVVSAIIAIVLLVRREYVLAIGWIVAQAGGGILIATLKRSFERSRPETPDALLASGWSFPSGHAMTTFMFCGMGAYLLLRYARSTRVRVLIVAMALTWCLVIAFTRLYLGAHFLSDVTASLMAATAWIAVCVSTMELGLRRQATPQMHGAAREEAS
jgi:membrane-associated phospholipid phosphatase